MKKAILMVCMAVASVTFTYAQGGKAKHAEEVKQGLKEQVKLSDDQINNVMKIDAEIKAKMNAVKADQALNETDKKAKMETLRTEKKKLIEASLGADKATKVDEFYASLKKAPKTKNKASN